MFNPSATSRGLSSYLWKLEQPAAAVANEYFVGAINRVGIEDLGDDDFYGTSYFVDPQGQFVGEVADAHDAELVVRDLDLELLDRGAQPVGVLPRPSPRRLRRPGRSRDDARSRGGLVVGPVSAQPMDVLVDGERDRGPAGAWRHLARRRPRVPPRSEVIDATGKYVVPGGVDVHTHMELPFGGTFASDTFETGTSAAAHGGTTTIVDFAVQRTGERVQDGLAAWHEKARGNCAIDYGFHQIIGGVDDESLKAMDELVDRGHHQLQAVHGLPRRLLQRRRPDPAGDADRGATTAR